MTTRLPPRRRRLIGTTSAGWQFMTSGFSRVAPCGLGVTRVTWRQPVAPSRVRLLTRAGFRFNARATVAVVDLHHARVEA
jgi:hypothetical protein